MLPGKFIVLDGPDGCGKGTQLDLLERVLASAGVRVVRAKDPGGTPIGDRIRHILLGYDLSEMDVHCETLLFMASRAQLVSQVVQPARSAGKTVLCDRFVSATCAYQGAAGYDMKGVIEVAPFAIGNCWPDVTVVLDIDAEAGFARTGRKPHHAGRNRKRRTGQQHIFEGAGPDAMESRPLDFHRRVRELFLTLPQFYPSPVVVIDGRSEPNEVHTQVIEALARVLL